MKSKIKQILNTITPQDLEEGCSRQVEEIEFLLKTAKNVLAIFNNWKSETPSVQFMTLCGNYMIGKMVETNADNMECVHEGFSIKGKKLGDYKITIRKL